MLDSDAKKEIIEQFGVITASVYRPVIVKELIEAMSLKLAEFSSVSVYNKPPEKMVHKSARILVAEDNVVNQRVIMRMLDKIGYKCTVVPNGKEAVDMFKTQVFDLIFMDGIIFHRKSY